MMTLPLTFDDLGTPLIEATFVVIDLETTGLDPATDAITEVGAVKIRGGEVLGELATLVQPQQPIPPRIARLTGIDDAMVADAPPIGEVLASLEPFMQNATMVAHNARFDQAFLRAAASRHDYHFDHPVIDTVRLARRLLRNEVPNMRLATLANRLGVNIRPDHRALTDARATVEVFHQLLERAGSLGATTLEDLRALTSSSSDRRFRKIDLVARAPRVPGVYMFRASDDTVLYVGKATNLRQRLRSYFTSDQRRGTEALVRQSTHVTWQTTATVIEAEVVELRAIHRLQPRFNRRSTRRLSGWYIGLTDEAMPRLSIIKTPRAHHQASVGPIASRSLATRFAEAASHAIGLRTCTSRLRRTQDHAPCVLKEMAQCDAPCDGTLPLEQYQQRVDAFTTMLTDPTEALGVIERRMGEAAAAERFERAAEERETLYALARGLWEHRSLNALAACRQVIVARPSQHEAPDTHTPCQEILVIVDGALSGTFVADVSVTDDELIDRSCLIAPGLDSGQDPDLAERRIVAAVLDDPQIRIVHVEGRLASPAAGGRALSRLVTDPGDFKHQTSPQQARRSGETRRQTPVISNQGLSASITAGKVSGSRPSQRTLAR